MSQTDCVYLFSLGSDVDLGSREANFAYAMSKMTVVAEKGGTLSLDNGTKIIIPKDAFTDANGHMTGNCSDGIHGN